MHASIIILYFKHINKTTGIQTDNGYEPTDLLSFMLLLSCATKGGIIME